MSAGTLPASRGTALAPRVSLDGDLLPETWLERLVHLRVELGVNAIGRATLRFTDHDHSLADAGRARIGAVLKVRAQPVADQGSTVDVFAGTVTAFGLERRRDGVPELVVVAHDRAYELARHTSVRTMANVTVGDAIGSVASSGGLTAEVSGAPTETRPYLAQADTDLGMLDELARRAGLDWLVRDTKLVVWKSWATGGRTTAAPGAPPTPTLSANLELLEYAVTVSGDAPTEVKVTGWDPVAKKELTATSTPGRGGVPDDLADAAGLTRAKAATVQRAAESPESLAEATSLAQAHARTGSVIVRARCTVTPTLVPGGKVTLTDMSPASGTYFVQEVEHVFTAAGFDTRFVAGDRPRPALLAGRPEPSSLRRTALAVGVVTNVQDPEPLGRVKVKFPGLDQAVESGWARIAYPGAGKGGKGARGSLWLPEVGDEVLVGFEDGDTRHPVLLGGLLPKDAGFPAELRANADVKVRRIASDKGARLDLGDGAGDAEEFVLLTLDGEQNRLRIGKDRADLEMPSGKPLQIAVGTAKITFDGNGAITLKATDITLEATNAVKIKGMSVAVEAQTTADVKGLSINVKASGTGAVEAGGPLTLKGAIVQVN